MTAVLYSYAKVNLTLDVIGKRSDGYHAIESVMQTISLHDTITLRIGEPGIRVSCDMPGIPTNEKNLAYKAASVLFANRGVNVGVDIDIQKRIPVEAGLGGGSSNAAAVIRGLNRLLDLSLSPAEECELAAGVGSDVPFFLTGGTAFVEGRGEIISPLPDIGSVWMLVIKPPFGVSTPWAYRRIDEMRMVAGELKTASSRIIECIRASKLDESLSEMLSNDLELPAIEQHPEIAEIKKALIDAGARGALMCGSGSAVFGLFNSETDASEAAGKIDTFGARYVVRTVSRKEAVEIEDVC